VKELKLIAITRDVSPSIGRCELTHLPRVSIDVAKARAQHRAYEETLRGLGVEIVALPAEPALPDSVFVEDAAVVLDECAVITRPGAVSRRPETDSIAAALRPYRALSFIHDPGTLDGGDVMRVGRTIFVGLSGRSNRQAIDELAGIVGPFGYRVIGVPVSGCLHLKSAVTPIAEDALLINPGWVNPRDFSGFRLIEVDPSETQAANALRAGHGILYPAAFPKTRSRLEAEGFRIVPVDVSELAKAEGAVTCCSLLFGRSHRGHRMSKRGVGRERGRKGGDE
jgi:dimethylargininase